MSGLTADTSAISFSPHNTCTRVQAAVWRSSSTPEQNLPQSIIGGFPLQAMQGARLALTGTDANGNELTFGDRQELSREIAEWPEGLLPRCRRSRGCQRAAVQLPAIGSCHGRVLCI